MIQSKPELSDYYDGDLTKDAIEAEINKHPNRRGPFTPVAMLFSAPVPLLVIYWTFTNVTSYIEIFFFTLPAVIGYFILDRMFSASMEAICKITGLPDPYEPRKSPYIEELKLALTSINSYEKDLRTWELYNLETGQYYWLGLRGRNLENAIANLLNRIGWQCKTTAVTGDGGIDLIASKGSTEVLIQCKGHAAKIGVGTIRDAAGVKAVQNKPFVVIAPIGFTKGSQEFADLSGVKLLDVLGLIKIAQDAEWIMVEG